MRWDFSVMSKPASRADLDAASSSDWRAPTQPRAMMANASMAMDTTTTEAIDSLMGQPGGAGVLSLPFGESNLLCSAMRRLPWVWSCPV